MTIEKEQRIKDPESRWREMDYEERLMHLKNVLESMTGKEVEILPSLTQMGKGVELALLIPLGGDDYMHLFEQYEYKIVSDCTQYDLAVDMLVRPALRRLKMAIARLNGGNKR